MECLELANPSSKSSLSFRSTIFPLGFIPCKMSDDMNSINAHEAAAQAAAPWKTNEARHVIF